MAPDGELRLFAVQMCGGLVYAGAKALVLGPSAAAVFSGFLFGSVIAIVLGLGFYLGFLFWAHAWLFGVSPLGTA